MVDSHVTTLADGRELGWLELGDPAGWPVFGFHGTPGSRRQLALDDDVIHRLPVRLVLADRPGYGLSTFQPERRLSDWADDVAQLADHLGVEAFSVFGVSGGGPHAAACAALLPDRVAAAALVSGVAPLTDAASAEGMSRANQVITALARRRSRLLKALALAQVGAAHRWPERAIDLMIRQEPPPDVAILTRPSVRAHFVLAAAHASRDAGRACAQDLELFARDWGFDLGSIKVPVHIWQGDEDRNVPPSHGARLHAAIPGSLMHECRGEGHFLVVDRIEEIATAITPVRA